MRKTIACKLVAYYRVSTDKQGQSGLGMDAQRSLVERFAEQSGCTVVASFAEVESGKRNDRPELTRAIAYARRVKATLVIATLSRLGRKVQFISGLMETGVPFVAADSPNDEKTVLHMKAVFAEDEAEKISQRTKAALAALKARGAKLGNPDNMTDQAREKGAKANADKADAYYAAIAPRIRQLRADGLTLKAIAERLNADGKTTRTGEAWGPVQVKRVLDRAGVPV